MRFMPLAIISDGRVISILTTNCHDAGHKVSKSNLDRGRKQKRPLRQTAIDTWHG